MLDQEAINWFRSRGPTGFWLSIGAIFLFRSELTLGLHSGQLAVSFGTLSSIIAAGVCCLALLHHPKGWLAVRIYTFAQIFVFGGIFLVLLGALKPTAEGVISVVAMGVGTVVWLMIFQYFKRPEIQRLFPPAMNHD